MYTDKELIAFGIVAAVVFITLFGATTFSLAARFSKRRRSLLLEQARREILYRQELLEAQLEMQEHTFNIISQDIHDNVGQILSLAKINLNIITLEQKENEAFLQVKELVTNAITELRNLGTGYYTERLVEQGLVAAIRHQLNQISKSGILNTHFECQTESVGVDKNDLVFLYRIIQETLNNVIKHAGAGDVWVSVHHENKEIRITIKDNGKGFSRNSPSFKPGIGLSSIQHRSAMIGATTEIISSPGTGTLVNISFKQKTHD